MEKVPQIVSERLGAASIGANHPDADLLTAFTERTLSKTEQTFVVEHLSACAECRDVVALALPSVEDIQAIARPTKSSWFTWPMVRWGAVAAGVVLVGSFGLVEYQHRHEARTNSAYTGLDSLDKEAKNAASPVQGPTPSQGKAQSTSPEENQRASNQIVGGAAKSEPAPSPSAPALVRVNPPTANLQHGPHVQFQQNATFQNQAPGSLGAPAAPARVLVGRPAGNAPVPASPEAVQAAAAAQNETANLDAGLARVESPSNLPQPDTRVERSKPATASVMTNTQASAPAAATAIGGPVGRDLARLAPVPPAATLVWNVTSSGTLQRSFDQGNTWQNVDVSGRADAGLQTFHGAAKELSTDALKKDSQNPLFRAVASNGPDVWAGAAGGLLYHSTDAGGHWARMVPSSSGARLSGDIVSLEFPDPQHGRIVTAAPEVWTTSDGGQTWSKQ